MACVAYIDRTFRGATLNMIEQANRIITEYQRAGYTLTLRQLYYRFVAGGFLANTVQNYGRLGSIINDARLAGYVDWDAIEDRTRNLHALSHWDDPESLVGEDSAAFRLDRWDTQPVRVEVWIEKEALAGVFRRVCDRFDVPFFACRGYTSQSEMWVASQRLRRYTKAGQSAVILHFGDHDPSGIDMTRDIVDRLVLFKADVSVRRLALNMDQVEEYAPPPNPAKTTDSRFAAYLKAYGSSSWELDALPPDTLAALVEGAVWAELDLDEWAEREAEERRGKALLRQVSERWGDIVALLDDENREP